MYRGKLRGRGWPEWEGSAQGGAEGMGNAIKGRRCTGGR